MAGIPSENDIITSGELAIQESEGKEEGLVQSKDKAQLAATTAMSIVNIALLKHLLDSGPENTKYFTTLLVLISTSLALQCLAGFISLSITNLLSFYKKYKDDPWQNFFIEVCHCKCVCDDEEEHKHELSAASHGSNPDVENGNGHVYRPNRCCPWDCTTLVREDYEYKALHKYKESIEELIDVELASVEQNQKLADLDDSAQNLREKILELKEALQADNENEHMKEELRENEGKLREISTQKEVCESAIQNYNVMRNKARTLYKYVDAIRKNWILKKVSFWQNIVNYMLYVVFILNAFVTGLGMAAPSPPAGGVNPSDMATTSTV